MFCLVAFAGILTGGTLVNYVITGYVYKVMIEVIMLPVTYAVIKQVKKREPGYRPAAADRVRQLRLVVRAEDYDRAVSFYRDDLGLPVEAAYSSDGGAEVMILDAGRATLELSNPAQVDLIDRAEVGHTGVAPPLRVCFEVDDAAAVTTRLSQAGAEVIATPTTTPWDSVNARLSAPAGLQLTIFTELEKR